MSLVVGVVVQGRPQDFASEDEVELVAPVSTNNGPDLDGEGGNDPVVVVLRLPGLGGNNRDEGFGGGFPGFSGFSGFHGLGGGDFPFSGFFGGSSRPRIPQIPQDPFDLVDDIFAGFPGLPRDEAAVQDGEVELIDPVDTTPQRPGCGLICTMFGIFNGLQSEIDVLNDEMHGGGAAGGFPGFPGLPSLPGLPEQEFDVDNATYEEKVLEDGTKVAVNKTVFADTDENGNTFYVQTTFTQAINNNNKLPALPPTTEEEEAVVLPVEDFNEEVEYEDDDSELPNEDPAFNEIMDGVDEGLKE